MSLSVCYRVSLSTAVVVALSGFSAFTFAGSTVAPKQAGDSVVRLNIVGVFHDEDMDGNIEGSGEISDTTTVALDYAYYITDHVSFDLSLMSFENDFTWHIVGVELDFGSVRNLMPELTLQYHFLTDQHLSPYVGAGVNYSIFYDEKESDINRDISYDNSFGYTIQAGFDYGVYKNWSLNVDVKKLFTNTDIETRASGMLLKFDCTNNPLIVSTGVGYRF